MAWFETLPAIIPRATLESLLRRNVCNAKHEIHAALAKQYIKKID